jgi:hypothetical protein
MIRKSLKLLRWSFLLLLIAIGALVYSNFHIYSRLTYEQPLCSIFFTSVNKTTFEATLQCKNQAAVDNTYLLNGDEWQLGARIIKWKATHNLLGFDALYRLDRLGGRYHDINDELELPRTLYALNAQPGFDLWRNLQQYQRWLPGLDAMYGSAVYAPMADGAEYMISLSQTGLVARPMNKAAKKALNTWE